MLNSILSLLVLSTFVVESAHAFVTVGVSRLNRNDVLCSIPSSASRSSCSQHRGRVRTLHLSATGTRRPSLKPSWKKPTSAPPSSAVSQPPPTSTRQKCSKSFAKYAREPKRARKARDATPAPSRSGFEATSGTVTETKVEASAPVTPSFTSPPTATPSVEGGCADHPTRCRSKS